MKVLPYLCILFLTILLITSCGGKRTVKNDPQSEIDTNAVADTGFTGIKQYMSNRYLVKEVTFKDGVREGLMKSFYMSGRLRQTFWYVNGLREDSAKWYYEEGQLFRSTPYLRDTVDGVQIQYYRDGRIKAKIGYKKGLRTPFFEEYDQSSKLVRGYPQIVLSKIDNIGTKGTYRITLMLSDKSTKVRFYHGDFSDNVFDTTKCERINTIKGIGTLDFKITGFEKTASVGIIADILTNFGNK
jgi:hypothetical protein